MPIDFKSIVPNGARVSSSFDPNRNKSAPPPPEGAAHYSWDADCQIQHTIDHNQSGGGNAGLARINHKAGSVAANDYYMRSAV